VAVTLKRFLAPDLVLILGILALLMPAMAHGLAPGLPVICSK
jgi:hypothetical protein